MGLYLQKLRLDNLKCFEQLELSFLDAAGLPRKWTVLIGENGVGKSTILQAAAVCLASQETAQELMFARDGALRVRLGAKRAELRALLGSGRPEPADPGGWTASYVLEEGSRLIAPNGSGTVALAPAVPLVCGYGTVRRLAAGRATESRDRPEVSSLRTLFDDGALLPSASEWLQTVHHALLESREQEAERLKTVLNKTIQAICKLLPDVVDVHVGAREVQYYTSDGPVPIEALSDGYRGMLSWLLHLLSRLADTYPEAEDLLACEGTVLIDELDAHLHPSWQRDVIFLLREAFPNLQFIVTTHSPLTVAGAREGEVVLLRREDGRVVADTDLASVRGWRADQILTSDLFGLQTTRDPETADLQAEHRALLRKGDKTTRRERERLAQLGRELSGLLPPPGDTPAERQLEQTVREMGALLADKTDPAVLETVRAKARDELQAARRRGGQPKR